MGQRLCSKKNTLPLLIVIYKCYLDTQQGDLELNCSGASQQVMLHVAMLEGFFIDSVSISAVRETNDCVWENITISTSLASGTHYHTLEVLIVSTIHKSCYTNLQRLYFVTDVTLTKKNRCIHFEVGQWYTQFGQICFFFLLDTAGLSFLTLFWVFKGHVYLFLSCASSVDGGQGIS